MNKRLTAICLASTALCACAPQTQHAPTPATQSSGMGHARPLWADFSNQGIVWSNGKQACVARAPQMQPVCPRLPAPTGPVAWDLEGRAWAALPRQGLITTLDGPPQSQVVGRVVALSSKAVYREDGSALSYAGTPSAGVVGRPSAVVTGGDGNDYAVVGRRFVQVGGATISLITPVDAGQGRYLYPTEHGAALAEVPTAVIGPNTYTLRTSGGAKNTGNTAGNTADNTANNATTFVTTLWKNDRPIGSPSPTLGTMATLRAIGTINGALWGLSETSEGKIIPLPLDFEMPTTNRSIRN